MKNLNVALCMIIAGMLLPSVAQPLRVVTSVNVLSQPLQALYAAEIDAGVLSVAPLMDIGADPHLYVPTRADLATLLDADVILFIGLGLEAQFDDLLQRIGNHGMGTNAMFVGDSVPALSLLGKECDTPPCLVDPHIWMDPTIYAHALRAAVGAVDEALGDSVERVNRLDQVNQLVDQLTADIEQRFEAAQVNVPLVTAHDAFSYYGRAFGLETVGLAGISTDVDPSVRRVQVLAQRIVAEQIPAVFLETSVPARGVKALIVAAESQGHTVSIKGPLYTDSLGEAGTEAGSWEGMIMANTIEITCALGAVTLEDCP